MGFFKAGIFLASDLLLTSLFHLHATVDIAPTVLALLDRFHFYTGLV
jgi:hypothetical protein